MRIDPSGGLPEALAITLIFIGVFALLHVPLTLMVGLHRAKTGIAFFDGGDQALLRRMRAHGNFTENVPIALLAMAAAELAGLPSWALWAGGASLLAGRLLHAWAVVRLGWSLIRAHAMLLTLLPIAGFASWTLWRACA
jgi:hypothetical protein